MFNLEYELGKWHQAMTAAGLKSPEVIRELEEHLRDDIAQQMRSGASAPEAFRIAVDRLGGPQALRTEFDLVRPAGVRATLRRHGWKLVLCSSIGMLAAIVVHALRPTIYVSEAKLLNRAIVADTSAGSSSQRVGALDERVLNPLMHEEQAILSSLDLANQVIQRIGVAQILRRAGGGSDANTALNVLRSGLLIQVAPGSSVIHLSFRHPDAAIVQPVLREIIDAYLKLHVATHRTRDERSVVVGKISNISSIQAPSPAFFDYARAYRPLAMIVALGISAGLAWILTAIWLSTLDRRQRGIG